MHYRKDDQVIINREVLGEPNLENRKIGKVLYHTGEEYVVGYQGNEFACSFREMELYMPEDTY